MPPASVPICTDRAAQALLNTRADAILAADRDGQILLWNPGAERIFGFTAAQAIGQSLDIIIPERLRARHWEGWRHTVASGQSRYGEGSVLAVPAQTAEGMPISVEFTITLLYDERHQVDGMVAILRDVTERFEEMRRLKRQIADWSTTTG